nr:hypothetical protein Iba_chr07bCG3800 [Ipomoea batatas]
MFHRATATSSNYSRGSQVTSSLTLILHNLVLTPLLLIAGHAICKARWSTTVFTVAHEQRDLCLTVGINIGIVSLAIEAKPCRRIEKKTSCLYRIIASLWPQCCVAKCILVETRALSESSFPDREYKPEKGKTPESPTMYSSSSVSADSFMVLPFSLSPFWQTDRLQDHAVESPSCRSHTSALLRQTDGSGGVDGLFSSMPPRSAKSLRDSRPPVMCPEHESPTAISELL